MHWGYRVFPSFLKKRNIFYAAAIPVIGSEIDPVKLEEFQRYQGAFIENKWERVRNLFKKTEMGRRHPEIDNAIHAFRGGCYGGAILGGALYTMKYSKEFLDVNDVTLFFNSKDAHVKLVKHSLVGFAKGVVKGGPIIGIFCGLFSLLTSCAEAYRGESGMMEFIFGGIGTGALFRINYGIKGMISGGLVGSVLGAIYGVAINEIVKGVGITRDEYKYFVFLTHDSSGDITSTSDTSVNENENEN